MSDYKVVNSRGKEIFTDVTLHPGEILQMELAARMIKRNKNLIELKLKKIILKKQSNNLI